LRSSPEPKTNLDLELKSAVSNLVNGGWAHVLVEFSHIGLNVIGHDEMERHVVSCVVA
jgi:hypothetical protein